MKLSDIYSFLNTVAPFDTQEEWDNSGLLVGDFNAEVKKVTVALDFTADVVNQAVENNSQLIVTHHPAIFTPLKSVTSDNCIYDCIKNGIAVISSHTNLDMADGGVNDVLCSLLELGKIEKLYSSDENSPIMRTGYSRIENIEDFVLFVSKKLGGSVAYNNAENKVGKIGVCSGSGCSLMRDIINAGCDTFVTGDASHHNFADANQYGINLIAAGHFETEYPVVDYFINRLEKEFDGLTVVKAKQSSPIKRMSFK